ncbi:FkbM family methyltransferase [Pontivivens insulae]|uniref:Methyltransferase FkbM domain-containing protein n=1 Tax=Pontivivens insulae TaxID=1639689 RepID=A0A2R8AC38_9RHOB|nr:FkbM family methyltransferase [Pontivivens insulae]RED13731.1 FkbM family methyltransferase [Pontivivens insulae]SPF29806.1 hypothetical protein POI8812_02124 [Pontivivens insulae]
MPIVRSARKRILRKFGKSRVETRFGLQWELDPTDWIDLRMIVGQPFEVDQYAFMSALIAKQGCSRFLDCGCNIGFYSVRLGDQFPDLQIDAFEPVGTTRAKLTRNVELNGFEDRITVHGIALSDSEGVAEIAIDPESSGLSTLAADEPDQARRDFKRVEQVPTRRLDDLVSFEGENIALKIDVEGFELTALAGMEQTLKNNKAVLQIETRPSNVAALDVLMASYGYRGFHIIGEDHYYMRAE